MTEEPTLEERFEELRRITEREMSSPTKQPDTSMKFLPGAEKWLGIAEAEYLEAWQLIEKLKAILRSEFVQTLIRDGNRAGMKMGGEVIEVLESESRYMAYYWPRKGKEVESIILVYEDAKAGSEFIHVGLIPLLKVERNNKRYRVAPFSQMMTLLYTKQFYDAVNKRFRASQNSQGSSKD
jgi:hypothetical protein